MVNLDPSSSTLSPLPTDHRVGLSAVATLGIVSFIATFAQFVHITWKIIRWNVKSWRRSKGKPAQAGIDLSLGLSQRHYEQTKGISSADKPSPPTPIDRGRTTSLNQFLFLFYNLIIAEVQQSAAFLLNTSWVSLNGIFVDNPVCWAQGWFISNGDLAVSCFSTLISIQTYMSVVRHYHPRQWVIYASAASTWVFVYGLALVGLLMTNNGAAKGGFFVRATAWCWISDEYENQRFWLHYFWIFTSLAISNTLYFLTCFSLFRSGDPENTRAEDGDSSLPQRASSLLRDLHIGFLVYPSIYIICTAPLALGRIMEMSGTEPSVGFYCFAGSMMASTGWMDVIWFSWTRSAIIFAASPDVPESGLSTFSFMRTPLRRYGNFVWIQGASRSTMFTGDGRRTRRSNISDGRHMTLKSSSQECLRPSNMDDMVVRMDVEMSIVVETNIERSLSDDEGAQGAGVTMTRKHGPFDTSTY
ncbi:uncharacterized protein JN550_012914 [Neoarthrinium moseri]|uniref:uncharacterized protein n=1 Tax=Neoarthrinium moseri TaxID=1658444 RepID=UPI001FDE614A|nr:uncharacterized protein JN550_012914 [Neoarthrinium moseri]KAI1858021.1 hypothetical protein JN550_012914 [Neoarthrinium moseri]